jgi:hypothetical protein
MASNVTMGDASSQKPPKSLNPTAAALRRKRRIELRSMQRSNAGDEDLDSESCAERKRARVEEVLVDPVTSKPRPSITGIKKQSRYDPGVPMDRVEIKAWRKEARRVRNRESAAASRGRNRDRISELEEEVNVVNSKYAAALQRIIELEAAACVTDSFTPAILRQDLTTLTTSEASRPGSPENEPVQTVSPPMSPAIPVRLMDENHTEEVNKKYQHIMELISRPIALCHNHLKPGLRITS